MSQQTIFNILIYFLAMLTVVFAAPLIIMGVSYIIGVIIYALSIITIVAFLIEVGKELEKAGL